MRKWMGVVAAFVVGGVMVAQAPAAPGDDPFAALKDGKLVIWIVHPAASGWTPQSALAAATLGPAGIPKTSQEQSASSFGTAASNVGQTAGSYGQAASTLGRNASNAGRAASNYGGTVGGAASNYGRTSGSYGQTAGSFGENLSTIATAGQKATDAAANTWRMPTHARMWDTALIELGAKWHLGTNVIDVREEDLLAAFTQSQGTADQPDVLLGTKVLPWTWANGEGNQHTSRVVYRMGEAIFPPQEPTSTGMPTPSVLQNREFAILRSAPHGAEARAFAVAMESPNVCSDCVHVADEEGAAMSVALQAVSSMLQSGDVGSATDADIAKADPGMVLMSTFGLSPEQWPTKMILQQRVFAAAANTHFAAVAVRTVITTAEVPSSAGLGVFHSVVVLRKGDEGPWRVLQITPDLTAESAVQAWRRLQGNTHPFYKGDARTYNVAWHGIVLAGLSPAAPADGDTRSPRPELWWDNNEDAGAKIVEWQRGSDDRWAESRWLNVPFPGKEHDQMRVTASFATEGGKYRWRVWSMGNDGQVVLSPWRSFMVVR